MPLKKDAASDDVSQCHPDYVGRSSEWAVMRDAARGATAVAAAGTLYLPMPSGFAAQPDQGAAMYSAYAARAQFPEIVEPTITGMVGIINRVEAQVELPAGMQYLWENCDGKGTTMESFHRRIVSELLTTGRYVLMTDAPVDGGDPYITGYVAEALINWSDQRDLFVFSEAALVRDGFSWEIREKWRVLSVENGAYQSVEYDEEGNPREDAIALPAVSGGASMTEIPVVVINPINLETRTSNPPLMGVSRAALAIYRLDADYRHQLFMSGQETFCITGMDVKEAPSNVGAGVMLCLPEGAEAKYVGPTCIGIQAHERAIEAEKSKAASLGASVFDVSEKAGVESGEALRIRRGAQVASLVSIAMNAAQGLEKALRYAAVMLGDDPEEVVVTPNLSFIDAALSPTDALALVQMWQGGAISYQTLWANLQKGEIASYDQNAEDEKELIDSETPAGGASVSAPETGEGDDATASQDDVNATFDQSALEDA